jgi:hypothetical protein
VAAVPGLAWRRAAVLVLVFSDAAVKDALVVSCFIGSSVVTSAGS